MKKLAALFLFFIALVVLPAGAQFNGCPSGFCPVGGTPVNPGVNAPRYWVGGTGNWDFSSTANWSATSGGSAGASAPGLTDDVIFDGSSGGGTVTLTSAQSVKSITMGTFTGTLNTNGASVSAQTFSGTGTATRTLNISNSVIVLTGTSAVSTVNAWDFGTVTNLTFTSTGSSITLTGRGGAFSGGGRSYGSVTLSGGANAGANMSTGTLLRGSNTFVNLTLIGTTSGTDQYTIGSATQTVTGTFTATGNSVVKRLWVSSDAIGTNRTINAAAVSISNTDFSNITGAGAAAPFTGSSVGDFKGNSQITATVGKTVYWVGNTGNWSDAANHWAASSGGAGALANFPLPQDTIVFDANSFTAAGQIITQDTPRFGTVDFTGATNNPTFNTSIFSSWYVGDLKLIAGMTCTGSVQHNWYMQAGQTATYTSAGVRIIGDIQINNAATGVLQLGDDADIKENLILNSGTFSANNKNVVLGTGLLASAALTRVLDMGSGTWTLRNTSGTLANFTLTTGLTLIPGTSTLKILSSAPTASGTRMLILGGLTWNDLWWADTAGTNTTLAITGANTFNTFKVDGGTNARTLRLPASTTTTATTLVLTGSSGALLSIVSSSSGTKATLSQAAGTVAGDYLAIKDNAATGGATFNATHSTDNGNNTGWTITP